MRASERPLLAVDIAFKGSPEPADGRARLPSHSSARGYSVESQLRSTKQLLGRAGDRFLLFGMLTHSKEGKLCLEDQDGAVELDFSQLVRKHPMAVDGY